jgi:hypothetical protein
MIISNSDCLWKYDTLVGNIVIWHNKSILGYNWITLNQLGNWQQDEYLITKRHMTGPDANLTKTISWPSACLKQSWTAYSCFACDFLQFFYRLIHITFRPWRGLDAASNTLFSIPLFTMKSEHSWHYWQSLDSSFFIILK